jgi:hypothetical protein
MGCVRILHEMKFRIGDSTDTKLVQSMSDEMQKCEDAWRSFEKLAPLNVLGVKATRKPAHDVYVRFLHHLYEFYMSAICRDERNTCWDSETSAKKRHEIRDLRVTAETVRCVRSHILAIEKGYAPSWANDARYYKTLLLLVQGERGEPITAFSESFRQVRNSHSGHVSSRRPNVSVIGFYQRYHALVYLLFQNTWSWRNASSTIGHDFNLASPS